MSVSNRIGIKIEAYTFYLEAIIEMKLDEIKSDHVKIIDSLDMKISAITSNKKILL